MNDGLADGEGSMVMNASSDSEQKEVMDLLCAQQGGGGDPSNSLVHLGSEDGMGSAPYDPVTPLPELPASTMHGDDDEDEEDNAAEHDLDETNMGEASPSSSQQLQMGEVMSSQGQQDDDDDDDDDDVDEDVMVHTMEAHIKHEEDSNQGPTDHATGMTLNLPEGLEASTSGVVHVTADGQVLFTPSDPGTQCITTDAGTSETTVQTIMLADGSTAYLQQTDGSHFQTVELEDGTTALVSAGNVSVPQKQDDSENVMNAKFLEGQTVQLEDGTTAFIQASLPKSQDHIQAVQLEDGSTAYLSTSLIAEGQIDPNDLILHQQVGRQATYTTKMTPTRRPSDRALALGEKAYRCNYESCGRLYTTQHHLKVHERSHTGDKPFKCDMKDCDRAFATSYGLKSHIRVHTGEKPYKCPLEACSKAFKTSGDLQKHVRTHTGEKPFKCTYKGCDRAFTTSNILKVHIRTHTGERPYACEECNKCFASATNYKNHVRIHSGEKPYVCTVDGCGKRFTEYSSLYKHHVVHTHNKPYTCDLCNKTYRQTSTLAMHRRTAHGEPVEDGATGNGVEDGVAQIGLVLGGGGRFEAAMDETTTNTLTIQEIVPENDDDSPLVIHTPAEGGQRRHRGGQKSFLNVSLAGSSGTTYTMNMNSTSTTVTPISLHNNQPGLALADLSGQQIFVVTDPSQLEMIQQLSQQANLVLQADTSAITSSNDNSVRTMTQADLMDVTDNTSSFLNTE